MELTLRRMGPLLPHHCDAVSVFQAMLNVLPNRVSSEWALDECHNIITVFGFCLYYNL